MLPESDKATYRKAWNDAINLLGVSATLNAGGTDYPVIIGFQKPRDAQIINEYTEEARVLTLRVLDIPGVTPIANDSITMPGGEEYAIKELHTVNINDILMGWRAVCLG
ncbi:hypothetical protein DRH27_00520 [Candidatus Falkowbacteria bacterium]|nr:MAG: hypothetical protein DRH27_00520 [Candidatus Falkowbacteria bacterium]